MPVIVDTRGISAIVLPLHANSDVFIDVERAVESKARFLALKRVVDVIVSGLSVIALSPVLLITAVAIALTSKGPILFRQTRHGRDNAPFTLYKFRSMYVDRQDVSGIAHTVEHDPRVTNVGRFIRRWYIDELPQLFNVLKGDMSIVGPRAQVMNMRAAGVKYEDLVPNYRARHAVRPGITGLAQVRGFRGEIKNAEQAIARVECDLEYIERASLWLDAKILLLTAPSVLLGSMDC
jgi:lipopolysaccharide/colanic/teichoic acid biosynthesis glycosyltransferase